MRYGIDIHGVLTLDYYREFIKPLMDAWMRHGERVYILSGPPTEQITKELLALGILHGTHYTAAFSIVDTLKAKGVKMWEKPVGSNHWWCDPVEWNRAKADIAEMLDIDVIIDDSPEYGEHMPEDVSFILIPRGERP